MQPLAVGARTSIKPDDRFAFGENWQSFVDHALDEHRIRMAVGSLQRILKVRDLHNETFLDVGCGSGLFSLAACLMGALRVTAFDYDPASVDASLALRERAGIPGERWHVSRGSILDRDFVEALEPADMVYSWGVLHHTGAMWQALDHTVAKVKPGGLLAIAIYNRMEKKVGGSAMWWQIKRAYNRAPTAVRRVMEYGYAANLLLRHIMAGRNPIWVMRGYGEGRGRGMDFWHDVRDWVGGFPYEFATAGEVFTYLHDTHGLELLYLNTHDGHGCNEFTFRRSADVSR